VMVPSKSPLAGFAAEAESGGVVRLSSPPLLHEAISKAKTTKMKRLKIPKGRRDDFFLI